MPTTMILLALLAAETEIPACMPADDAAVCAPASPELQRRVSAMLNTIDRPVPPAAWRRIGPPAVPVLTAIATSEEELPIRRARAVEALSILGGDAATATTRELASSAAAPWDVRAAAVRGLGRLLAPDRLVAELRPVLERDPHRNVREVAATVLARKAGETGCAAVRAQARRDASPGRAPYARALSVCR